MTHDPREVPQITMADIRKHTGEGMVSEQSVIDAANEVLKEIYTSPPPAEGQTEREIAAQAALARVRKVRDGYANQAKFADVDQASYFREFVRRLDDAVNPKPSAPPWNGAALRREAPAPEGVSTPPAAAESNASVEARLREDARRYRRLQILGCAPYGSPHLLNGEVMRFTNLDAFVDKDIDIHPSRGEALSAVGDEAKKSEGIQSAYGEYTPITVRASTTLSSPTAERREIVARALMEKWPGDYAWGDETREPNELAFETADAILAALDGGGGA